MEFPAFDYMRFARTATAGARISLAASGLAPPPLALLGDPPPPLDVGDTGASGTLFLRERVARRTGVEPEDVLITPGASGAIHLVASALGDVGGHAVVERPAYPPLHLAPRLFGCDVRFFDRRLEEGFRLDPGRVGTATSACGGPASVWVTNLHNPTGALAAPGDLAEAAAIAARSGSRLVCCELYGDFLGPDRPRPVATLVPGAVSIGSLTKAYGLGGLRVGWVLCRDRAFLERLERHFDLIDANCAMPSLRLAAAALDHVEAFEARALRASVEGLAPFSRWARAEIEKGRIELAPPAGGIVAFPRLVGVSDTLALARRVRERHGVQVTPGEFFGAPGFLRLGFGIDPSAVEEALSALSEELP